LSELTSTMPFLTISTLLLLSGVFGGGCLIAWYVTDRRHERRRVLLEETMTRELEQRYHVYQDLEQSFHRVFSRLDEMKDHWMVSPETSMPEHSLMRVDNPELWDLEREYERRQAEQLAEISDKSRRVVELMEKIQVLEPLAQQLAERDCEFVQMEENQRALEETRRARVGELTAQVEELEPLVDEVCDLRSQLERAGQDVRAWRDKHDSSYLRSTEDQARLQQQMDECNVQLEQQVAAQAEVERKCDEQLEHLKGQVSERDERIEAVCGEVDELKSEVEARDSQLFMRDELVKERDSQLADVNEELARTRTERDRKLEEVTARDARLEELESAWSEATGQVAAQRSKLMNNLSSFEAAQSMLSQLKPMLDALESNLTVEEKAAMDLAQAQVEPEVVVEDVDEELHQQVEALVEMDDVVDLEEPIDVPIDEPVAALPAENDTVVESAPADEYDLSVLDGDEDDFDTFRDVE
jgi:hypothetical protein